jgi:hypothetical protein
MEEDDDDEYFEMLHRSATQFSPTEDDFESIPPTESNFEFGTDREYFEFVSHTNSNAESYTLPEDDMIWQNLLRSGVSLSNRGSFSTGTLQVVDLAGNPLEVLLIKQWLFSNLPRSSKAFCMLTSTLIKSCWVDNIRHPSTIVLVDETPRTGYVSATVFSALPDGSPSMSALQAAVQLLHGNVVSKGSAFDNILLEGLDGSVLSAFTFFTEQTRLKEVYRNDCSLFVCNNLSCGAISSGQACKFTIDSVELEISDLRYL